MAPTVRKIEKVSLLPTNSTSHLRVTNMIGKTRSVDQELSTLFTTCRVMEAILALLERRQPPPEVLRVIQVTGTSSDRRSLAGFLHDSLPSL